GRAKAGASIRGLIPFVVEIATGRALMRLPLIDERRDVVGVVQVDAAVQREVRNPVLDLVRRCEHRARLLLIQLLWHRAIADQCVIRIDERCPDLGAASAYGAVREQLADRRWRVLAPTVLVEIVGCDEAADGTVVAAERGLRLPAVPTAAE